LPFFNDEPPHGDQLKKGASFRWERDGGGAGSGARRAIMAERYVRVVTLWIRPGQEGAFETFEREAASIMARHGGRIDQAVRLTRPERGEADAGVGEPPFELHIVSFPDQAAFAAYDADSATIALRSRRDLIIARTVSAAGRQVGPYSPSR
jgi:hypothetical protein